MQQRGCSRSSAFFLFCFFLSRRRRRKKKKVSFSILHLTFRTVSLKHNSTLHARRRRNRKAILRAYLSSHTRRSQQKCVCHILFLRLRDEHDHHPQDSPATTNSHVFVTPLPQSTVTDHADRSTTPCVPDEGIGHIGRGSESGSCPRASVGPQAGPATLQIAQTVKVAKSVRKHALVGPGFRVWGDPWRGIVFHCACAGRTRLLWPC